MTELTEEQQELLEQSIALRWQNDTHHLIRTLKNTAPNKLAELRDTQYFAEEYQPTENVINNLSTLITTSFIQDLPYSQWQTAATQNAKKLLSDSQKNMLSHWGKEKKKLSGKNTYFSKDAVLSSLGTARIYAVLNNTEQTTTDDSKSSSPFSNDLLLTLAHALPFFDENSAWTEKAQKRFSRNIVKHLSYNLVKHNSSKRCDFIIRKLGQTTIPEQNPKRTLFMIKLLGSLADTFKDRPNRKALEVIIKNLTNQNRLDAAKQVRRSFHLDAPPSPLRFLKFMTRGQESDN